MCSIVWFNIDSDFKYFYNLYVMSPFKVFLFYYFVFKNFYLKYPIFNKHI